MTSPYAPSGQPIAVGDGADEPWLATVDSTGTLSDYPLIAQTTVRPIATTQSGFPTNANAPVTPNTGGSYGAAWIDGCWVQDVAGTITAEPVASNGVAIDAGYNATNSSAGSDAVVLLQNSAGSADATFQLASYNDPQSVAWWQGASGNSWLLFGLWTVSPGSNTVDGFLNWASATPPAGNASGNGNVSGSSSSALGASGHGYIQAIAGVPGQDTAFLDLAQGNQVSSNRPGVVRRGMSSTQLRDRARSTGRTAGTPRGPDRGSRRVRAEGPEFAGNLSAPAPKPAPEVTHASFASRTFEARTGTTLRLTLSEAAIVTVVVTQKVSVREVKGTCKANAKKGRRCTLTVQKAKPTFHSVKGHNTVKFRVKSLRPGRYTVTLTARSPRSLTSKPITFTFTIKKPKTK